MLKIRLQRVGRKNFPSFRVVLVEHKRPVKGKFLELLGFYNPLLKQKGLKKDRINYWLSQGVTVSPTIHNLLAQEGVISDKKIKAWRPKKKEAMPTGRQAQEGAQSKPEIKK
ncbi:MAG: 30S ribosomal protein S16 [Patescibacteria group bacterium]